MPAALYDSETQGEIDGSQSCIKRRSRASAGVLRIHESNMSHAHKNCNAKYFRPRDCREQIDGAKAKLYKVELDELCTTIALTLLCLKAEQVKIIPGSFDVCWCCNWIRPDSIHQSLTQRRQRSAKPSDADSPPSQDPRLPRPFLSPPFQFPPTILRKGHASRNQLSSTSTYERTLVTPRIIDSSTSTRNLRNPPSSRPSTLSCTVPVSVPTASALAHT